MHPVVRGFTPGNTSFLVINHDFHLVLAMDVIVCTAGVWNVFPTSVGVWIRSVWSRKCYGLCWNLSWWSHSAQNCSRNIECRKLQIHYSWSYRSVLSAAAKLWSRLSTWQCKMSRGLCLSRLSEPESDPCSSLAGVITGSVTNWIFMW